MTNKLKLAMEKIQRRLQLGKKLSPCSSTKSSEVDDEQAQEHETWINNSRSVPEDVKEGHFAVVAVDEDYGLAERFVVPLRYLNHPLFSALLERAAEIYGFDHGGAVNVPCRPSVMERLLAERWEEDRDHLKKVDVFRLSSS